MIYGERVRHARELTGKTQTAVADAIEISQAAVAQIESNSTQPSETVLAGIARETGFPPAFFAREPHRDFSYGSLLFRSHKTGRVRDEKRAIRIGQLIDELFVSFSQRLDPVPVLLTRLNRNEHSLEEAARLVRSALGIPLGEPVGKLVSAVERAGVVIYSTPIELEKQQAFSLWAGARLDRPVIALVKGQPGDRLRWSISHELGHLVLHPAPIAGVDIEKEAHRFAAEFLMPSESFGQEVTGPVTLTTLMKLKTRWKVAMQAIVMRCRDLSIITDRQARYLFQQISARGWRKKEPVDIPVEQPRALRQMAEMLYGQPIDYGRLASDNALPPMLAREIFEGLVVARADRSAGQSEVISLAGWARDQTAGQGET
jgi:Zn-dependent peptidase ImmA (M78 family)/DNA-binding XRE family transcriptional regulator